MNESARMYAAYTIRIVMAIALTAACYAVLTTFLWAWLAAALALIATYYLEVTEPVVAVIALCVALCD